MRKDKIIEIFNSNIDRDDLDLDNFKGNLTLILNKIKIEIEADNCGHFHNGIYITKYRLRLLEKYNNSPIENIEIEKNDKDR